MHPLIPPAAASADILPAAGKTPAEGPAPLNAFRQVFAQLQARAPQSALAPLALSVPPAGLPATPEATRTPLFPPFGTELLNVATLDAAALAQVELPAGEPLPPPAALTTAPAELTAPRLDSALGEVAQPPREPGPEPAAQAQHEVQAQRNAEAEALVDAQSQALADAQPLVAALAAPQAATAAPVQTSGAGRAAAPSPVLAAGAQQNSAALDASTVSPAATSSLGAVEPQVAVTASAAPQHVADAPLPAAPAVAETGGASPPTAPAAAAPSAPAPAPLPQTSLTLAAPLDSARWQQDLGQQLASLVRHGDQRVSLHLNPAELGPLVVELKLSEQQAQMQFLSAHAPVRHAVEQALPLLREALAEQGISLGEAQVGEQRQGSERQQAGAGRQDSHEQPAVLTDSSAPAAGSSAAQPLDGRVNLYI